MLKICNFTRLLSMAKNIDKEEPGRGGVKFMVDKG